MILGPSSCQLYGIQEEFICIWYPVNCSRCSLTTMCSKSHISFRFQKNPSVPFHGLSVIHLGFITLSKYDDFVLIIWWMLFWERFIAPNIISNFLWSVFCDVNGTCAHLRAKNFHSMLFFFRRHFSFFFFLHRGSSRAWTTKWILMCMQLLNMCTSFTSIRFPWSGIHFQIIPCVFPFLFFLFFVASALLCRILSLWLCFSQF